MPEDVAVGAVSAIAAPDALDALVVPGRATACRVADDELLLVCDRDVTDEVAREVETRLTASDLDAVVLDTSDGWAAAVLDREELVFARLSRLRLPSAGFLQGEVAHVPAKILVEERRIRILVAAALEEHLRSRIAAAREARS